VTLFLNRFQRSKRKRIRMGAQSTAKPRPSRFLRTLYPLVELIGFALVSYGLYTVAPAAGLIAAGLFCVVIGEAE